MAYIEVKRMLSGLFGWNLSEPKLNSFLFPSGIAIFHTKVLLRKRIEGLKQSYFPYAI